MDVVYNKSLILKTNKMNKEKVGFVTEEEKEEIRVLHERKLALNELIPSLGTGLLSDDKRNEIYEKVLQDMGKTNSLFQAWWNSKSVKYNWKSMENGNWSIDFDTNEIFLVTN